MRLMQGEGDGDGNEWWVDGQREAGAEEARADAEEYGGVGGMVVGWAEEKQRRWRGYYGELRWNGSSAYPDGAVYTGEIGNFPSLLAVLVQY